MAPSADMNGGIDHGIRFIPLSYRNDDSHASALRLVTALIPAWKEPGSNVEFVRFTDGITNTLLKAVNRRADLSKEETDAEAVLLRAYGQGTDVIIDRQRETQNHELLMQHGLAPQLLARFDNGMLYRFIRGSVTHSEDLRRPPIYRGVARRLAEWHAVVPCISAPTGHSRKSSLNGSAVLLNGDGNGNGNGNGAVTVGNAVDERSLQAVIDGVAPGKPPPNVWTVMQKWILALPTDTEAQRARQAELQRELARVVGELSNRPGLGKNGLVFAHCDLLSGNVIVLPPSSSSANHVNGNSHSEPDATPVAFIDYEYATPSPAAFDLANHFAEWGGFDCDFNVLPTRAQRRDFIREYVRSYFSLLPRDDTTCAATHDVDCNGAAVRKEERNGEVKRDAAMLETEVEKLMAEVDAYRGVPGFYWGIWALIQAQISDIDFDYASYAEVRLGEYWAWRGEVDGVRKREGTEIPLRERRWALE